MVDFKKELQKQPRLDLNPSSAERWSTCTASPRFIFENWDKLPPRDTVFSQEGTTAHEVASATLQQLDPRINDPYFCPVPVNAEMRWHAWNYAEYVNALRERNSVLYVEKKFPLWYMPERNAMVDAAINHPNHLHIVDYKYGEGIIVSPVENPQVAIYARCVIENERVVKELKKDFPIFVHIYQPRGRAAVESEAHVWETNWGEILEFTKDFSLLAGHIVHASSSLTPWLVFKPSEKVCQWCPAKGFCAARQKVLTQDIEVLSTIDESTKHFPPVQSISVRQFAAILKHKDEIVKWLRDAEEYAQSYMSGGGQIPGFKLVLSRGGNRFWSDPKKAAKMLLEKTHLKRDEVIEEKVASPAAVEKLLGKNGMTVELLNLIAKNPGSPVIAPEDDKRESCLVDARADFEALPEV